MPAVLAYWERRRVIYNALLVLVVAAWCALTWPHFRPAMHRDTLVPLAVLALAANICYSAAYLLELAAGMAGATGRWQRHRGQVFVAGTVLALLLANYWIADEIYPFVSPS